MGIENNVSLSPAADGEHAFVATVDGMRSVETGQPAVARVTPHAIHLVDAETGTAPWTRSLERLELSESRL